MTPPHGIPLTDTGEHDAVEDITPDQLEAMAGQMASKAFVVNTCAKCWVKRWVRGVRIKWAFILGFIAAVQVGGVLAIRAVTEQVVRTTVVEVLKERKIIVMGEEEIEQRMRLIAQEHAYERMGP